jgi:hypothetical protein
MKNMHIDIDYDEVLKRIEKEMEGYSRTEWANKVGVRINVVSNIHGANARQNPSLKYILAVSVATQKPMDYFLWGRVSYIPSELPDTMVKEDEKTYSDSYNYKILIGFGGPRPGDGQTGALLA